MPSQRTRVRLAPEDPMPRSEIPCVASQRQLLRYALHGERAVHTALLQAGELRKWITCDTDREIKPILERLLEQKWHLNEKIGIRTGPERRPDYLEEPRVCKFLQPLSFRIVRKDDSGERRPVDVSRGPENGVPEVRPQCRLHLIRREHPLADDDIRIDMTVSQVDE